jgi:hypothetical protein
MVQRFAVVSPISSSLVVCRALRVLFPVYPENFPKVLARMRLCSPALQFDIPGMAVEHRFHAAIFFYFPLF